MKSHVSTVDHIVWNEATNDAIDEAGVIHIPENLSDHCPVYCKMNFSHIPVTEAPIRKPGVSKPSWSKAS